ncbi:uncharacterized protein LOC121997629 [Zingiber officinale]|uniref:uncharacterized protein LOC121997629 n=1 Tax=Zingiber officinale TaxID=94328 RepID=UPI001C4B01EC|nr:uncharacterized protein LOC121997629 [Zingiber officinale]
MGYGYRGAIPFGSRAKALSTCGGRLFLQMDGGRSPCQDNRGSGHPVPMEEHPVPIWNLSQTEVTNREIVRGLKVKQDYVGGDWVKDLPNILWAYRTTPRKSTILTPFHLVYGNEAIVLVEVGVPSDRQLLYDPENAERRLLELDLISETRERTAARLIAYHQKMQQTYDKKVIPCLFGEGDLVWKRIKRVGEVTKLAPQWDASYKVIKKLASDVYYLQDAQGRCLDRPWSANYL